MARKRSAVKKSPRRHTKGNDVLVALNDADFGDLTRLADIESNVRGEQVGRATLLREFAMPQVRERLSAAQPVAA